LNATRGESPRFAIGVDVGVVNDRTAIAVVEILTMEILKAEREKLSEEIASAIETFKYILHIRYLDPFPGVSTTQVTQKVADVYNDELVLTVFPRTKVIDQVQITGYDLKLRPYLAVDGSGLGRGVVDNLKNSGASLVGVSITAGRNESPGKGGYRNVPKAHLIQALQEGLYDGWLKIAEGLEHGQTLKDELMAFRPSSSMMNINQNYGGVIHKRETEHDDLVLASGLACWVAVWGRRRGQRRPMSGSYTINWETGALLPDDEIDPYIHDRQ